MRNKDIKGFVYLYHFDSKYKHASHYIGWTEDLESRDQSHQNGTGARLLQVIRNQGIGFRIVRIWEGTRRLEKKLKSRKNASQLCPVCRQAGRTTKRKGNR